MTEGSNVSDVVRTKRKYILAATGAEELNRLEY